MNHADSDSVSHGEDADLAIVELSETVALKREELIKIA